MHKRKQVSQIPKTHLACDFMECESSRSTCVVPSGVKFHSRKHASHRDRYNMRKSSSSTDSHLLHCPRASTGIFKRGATLSTSSSDCSLTRF